jgi:hypothetical protein
MGPGEIYLAQFPCGDVPGMKLRPVLLLTGTLGSVPEVLVAYISSVIPAQLLPSDVLLDPIKPERSFVIDHSKVAGNLELRSFEREVSKASTNDFAVAVAFPVGLNSVTTERKPPVCISNTPKR